MEQKRFLLALVLSAAIIFVWQYFVAQNLPETNEASRPEQRANSTTSQPTPAVTQPQAPVAEASAPESNVAPSDAPPQTIVVSTPLYEVEFDNQGAVATSWILKKYKDKDSDRPLYSVGGTKESQMPLQLIPPRAKEQNPREVPLRLLTGDTSLDSVLNSRNYGVSGVSLENGRSVVEIREGEQRQLEFTLQDAASGLNVTKTITFDANRYDVGLNVKVLRGEQVVPNVRLAVGPSIGDQGIPHYTFYSVAPEGVVALGGDGDYERLYASTINEDSADRQTLNNSIQWAGVGDTYFAMAAVPSRPTDAVEYRTTKYEHEHEGTKEDRFLITGFLTIPADGSPIRVYTGPKDHDLLLSASKQISDTLGRTVDLELLIDYGFLSTISRPLAIPILKAIKAIYSVVHSYGVAIIIFTILIYSLFFPLKWRSSKAMKKAQKYAPRMKEIQEKLKGLKPNDPKLKELQMEQLRLMKEGNPLGGCLPLLIQMPFFFALFRAITISLDFRQASFLWMPDLSATDPLHLLPVMMAASMLVVQLVTPAPSADPLQRKMMAVVIPAVMLYALWSAPAGLLVYWFVGNLVLFAQQMLINRLTKSEDDAPPPETTKSGFSSNKKLSTARAS
ncbi:MAG: membrane protein insertase YidC [Pyrinomonadaceae bacterium]|nr:membrane protein insertase YidC [Pyrinomonadaceae bacterium]